LAFGGLGSSARVGIEARISHLKRGLWVAAQGARTWVGLGVFAFNLRCLTVVAAG
jgi:hypothetical protein